MAVSSKNVPCKKPELCGVQTHRPGTVALCSVSPGAKGKSVGAQATLSKAPKLASAYQEPQPEKIEGIADLHENIRQALGPNGYRKIVFEDLHGDARRMYHPSLTFSRGEVVTPDPSRPFSDVYGDQTIEISRGVWFKDGDEEGWGVESFKEDERHPQDVPEVIGLSVLEGMYPSNRDYGQIDEYGAEDLPGYVSSDGAVVYVKSEYAGQAIEHLIDTMGHEKGEGEVAPAYNGLPSFDRSTTHPLEFWPRHVELPASVSFEEHMNYWNPGNDPQDDVDMPCVKTVITMPNGATASVTNYEGDSGPELNGPWDQYHVWDQSEPGRKIKDILGDYAEHAESKRIGETYKAS